MFDDLTESFGPAHGPHFWLTADEVATERMAFLSQHYRIHTIKFINDGKWEALKNALESVCQKSRELPPSLSFGEISYNVGSCTSIVIRGCSAGEFAGRLADRKADPSPSAVAVEIFASSGIVMENEPQLRRLKENRIARTKLYSFDLTTLVFDERTPHTPPAAPPQQQQQQQQQTGASADQPPAIPSAHDGIGGGGGSSGDGFQNYMRWNSEFGGSGGGSSADVTTPAVFSQPRAWRTAKWSIATFDAWVVHCGGRHTGGSSSDGSAGRNHKCSLEEGVAQAARHFVISACHDQSRLQAHGATVTLTVPIFGTSNPRGRRLQHDVAMRILLSQIAKLVAYLEASDNSVSPSPPPLIHLRGASDNSGSPSYPLRVLLVN